MKMGIWQNGMDTLYFIYMSSSEIKEAVMCNCISVIAYPFKLQIFIIIIIQICLHTKLSLFLRYS